MPVPNSVWARLKTIRWLELLGIGCVDAKKLVEAGNFAKRVKVAVAADTFNGYEYNCEGRIALSLRPSDDVVGTVPSAFMFNRVSNTRVVGTLVPS